MRLVEAISCGRPAVVTNAGGNTDLCIDSATGFAALARVTLHFGQALGRAWVRRMDWHEMGFEHVPCGLTWNSGATVGYPQNDQEAGVGEGRPNGYDNPSFAGHSRSKQESLCIFLDWPQVEHPHSAY